MLEAIAAGAGDAAAAASKALGRMRRSRRPGAAAEGFLSSWVTQPVDDPYPDELAFAWRVKLYRDLTGLPEPVIANPAGWIVERAEKRATEKRAIAAK